MQNDADEQRAIVRMLGAVLGDVIREQDGEEAFSPDRGDPAGFGRLSPGGIRGGGGARFPASSRSSERPRPSGSCIPSPASCRSPISPRTISSAAVAGRAMPARIRWPARCGRWPKKVLRRQRWSSLLSTRADRAGHHRPPQRSAAQERAGPPERDRGRSGSAGPRRRAMPSGRMLKRTCAGRCRSSGARACCAMCASPWMTRSRTRSRISRSSFLPALPALYAHWKETVGRSSDHVPASCASAHGSAATGTAIRMSTARRCARRLRGSRARRCDLSRTDRMRWAQSCRCRRASRAVTPELQALADRASDASPQRADEPYRRALTGIYARLAATLTALTGERPAKAPMAKGEAYATPV